MKQIIKNASYLIVLAFLACSTQGCLLLAAGAGAAGATYAINKGERIFDRHFEKVYNATKNTFKKKDLIITSDTRTQSSGHINGKLEDGTSISVIIEALTTKTTKVTVRVGAFGDEARSNMFIEDIAKRL